MIDTATTYQPNIPLGKGQLNERLTSITLSVSGKDSLSITRISFQVEGNPKAIQKVRLYANGSLMRWQDSTSMLLGESKKFNDSICFSINQKLAAGTHVFWLVGDIKKSTPEGTLLGLFAKSYTVSGQVKLIQRPENLYLRPVLLAHQLLFSAGDYGSKNYRIPAIVSNGKRVLVACDKRYDGISDLPNNIDLISQYSDDYGKTWSKPITIADFGSEGASDPALVWDKKSGDLLCLFASHNGLMASTPSNSIRFQVARSSDFGETWQESKDFTSAIYLPGWQAAWVASGSAHQLEDGRIVAAIGVRTSASTVISNYMIYSDDGGHSWHASPGQASPVGDEAKIVELNDHRLMMLIRNRGKRKVSFSSDRGNSWTEPVFQEELIEPAVDGDFIRYSSTKNGASKDRLLFSITAHPTLRKNLTVFVSYDEGKSWGTSRVICPIESAYSALTTFDDGTIGVFYENGEYETYQLYYTRFSLRWLTNGTDTFSKPQKKKSK